ncbi:MAG: hypothetical protein Q4C73_06520 [Eubacteriales bacterium]|nr:hypothetical protein [Eubacteriales bacterium]
MLYGWVSNGERLTDDEDWANTDENVYYLGDWNDGSMKTGWQRLTVYDSEEDEDVTYWFWFNSNGKRYYNDDSSKTYATKTINSKKYGFDERGVTGIDDNKYIYKYGQRIKADSDEKYIVVQVTDSEGNSNNVDTGADGVVVTEIDSADLRSAASISYKNDDNETVRFNNDFDNTYYLVNTSGAIQKKKTAAKDGDDWYFYTEDYHVRLYSNNKSVKSDGVSEPGFTVTDWEQLADYGKSSN